MSGIRPIGTAIPLDIAAPLRAPGGSGGIAGFGGTPNLPSIGRTISLWDPDLYPIPDAQQYNFTGSIATAVVETGTITGVAVPFPAGANGVLRSVNIYITNMLPSTNVTFTVLNNGVPVVGFSGLSMFPRTATAVSNAFDAMVRLFVGSNLSVSFSNIDGGSYVVGASLGGWYQAETSAKRWREYGY